MLLSCGKCSQQAAAKLFQCDLPHPRSHPSGRAQPTCSTGELELGCSLQSFVIAEPDSVLLYFTLLSCHISPRKQATPLAVSAPALCLSKGFYCCDEINSRTKSNLQKEVRAAAEAEANEEHFQCLAKLLHELLLKKMSTGLQASLPETAS